MRSMSLAAAFAAAVTLAACDSAPSEESPVAPSVVCEAPAEDGTCPDYDAVVTQEDLRDGQVITDAEESAEHED